MPIRMILANVFATAGKYPNTLPVVALKTSALLSNLHDHPLPPWEKSEILISKLFCGAVNGAEILAICSGFSN